MMDVSWDCGIWGIHVPSLRNRPLCLLLCGHWMTSETRQCPLWVGSGTYTGTSVNSQYIEWSDWNAPLRLSLTSPPSWLSLSTRIVALKNWSFLQPFSILNEISYLYVAKFCCKRKSWINVSTGFRRHVLCIDEHCWIFKSLTFD